MDAGADATYSPETARAWVDIDLGALAENARTIATVSGSRLLAMVKANGYGLGAVEVARALEPLDPWGFGVATVDEGAELRAAGIARPILLATPLMPAWIDGMLSHRLRPLIGDLAALRAWMARTPEPFHVEIDTGMGRSGLRWDDEAAIAALTPALASAPGWEGVATHFHSSDSDAPATERQWERFGQVLAALPRRPPLVHAANSAAALCGRRYAADLIRPGIFLYGGRAGTVVPRPVAALRARVVAVRTLPAGDTVSYGGTWRAERPTVVATLGIGYADGLIRAAEAGPARPARPARLAELGGGPVPIVGRVTMDMCMVAAAEGVRVGDVATMYGGLVSLDEHASAAGTIAYEVLTALGARVGRRYLSRRFSHEARIG